MDMTFYKQQCVTEISLRVFEIPQSLNTRSPTHTSSASVVANNGFLFFLFLFISFQRTKFNSLRLPGNIMNGTKLISWCCKIIEIEENHMHSGINQRNFEKEILNLNCDKWTNVGESMWKGSRRLKWRLPLSAFHKAWLLTILSADLILFNLFVSLQPFTRPFLMEHQNEDFFFLSVSPPPISPSVASSPSCLYFFFSLPLFLFVIIRYWCRCKSYQCFTW